MASARDLASLGRHAAVLQPASRREAARSGQLAALGAAAAGGALHFLGFVGFGLWPLALVSLALLWWSAEPAHAPRARDAAWRGLAFGCVAFMGGFHWLWSLLDVFLSGRLGLGLALWTAYALWFGARFAVCALLYHALRRRGVPLLVAGPLPLVAVEWLQPDLFPVFTGVALVDQVRFIQVAEIGGPLGLTALVALANAVALESWRWLREGRARPDDVWRIGVLVALLCWGYGEARIRVFERAMEAAPPLRIGLVQANLGVPEKRDDPEHVHQRHLDATRALLAEGPLDLVIWPETVVSRGIQRPLPLSGRFVREDVRVPLLFGATTIAVRDGRRERFNSALLVAEDGRIHDAYDKNLLVPFTEYLPFARWLPGLAAWLPEVQGFSAGHATPPLRLGRFRISTPICYEAIRPGFVSRMVAAAAPHLIVSLANDAWFGPSQEPWLHDAVARLRAVEHRRFLVRATNSGVSSVVDPLGRVVARTGAMERATLRVTVRMLGAD